MTMELIELDHFITPRDTTSTDGGTTATGSPCEWHGLAVFPQGTLSTAQGFCGVRRWYLKGADRHGLRAVLKKVCDSHWPAEPDYLPIAVQWGAADDKVQISNPVKLDDISNDLETYDHVLIVAQYQLLHIQDIWPVTGKPAHPPGSILTLQVRGGGEMLQVDITGLSSIGGGGASLTPNPTWNNRIRIPLTEYHLTCDRLTDRQLCDIMKNISWQEREGTVNAETEEDGGLFLGEPEGTLLFDTWTLDQTFAPDVDNPRRWRLGCVLKCRHVPYAGGTYPDSYGPDGKPYNDMQGYPVGWNHDFARSKQREIGWWFITMQAAEGEATTDSPMGGGKKMTWTPHGDCYPVDNPPRYQVPRYPYAPFRYLFCDSVGNKCLAHQDEKCDAKSSSSELLLNAIETDREIASSSESQVQSTLAEILASSRKAAARRAARDRQQGSTEL